jgi:hypothetical protein
MRLNVLKSPIGIKENLRFFRRAAPIRPQGIRQAWQGQPDGLR